MSTNKYESIIMPFLKKVEYSTWKVNILIYLEAPDPNYVDKIYDGPYIPKKLVLEIEEVPEHYVRKTKAEMTPEETNELLTDAKVKHILTIVWNLLCLTGWLLSKRQMILGIPWKLNVKEHNRWVNALFYHCTRTKFSVGLPSEKSFQFH